MRIACVLFVAALAAGCGGSQQEPKEPKDPKAALKQMFTEFSEGNAKGDWDTVCSRVTRDCAKQMQMEDAWSQPRVADVLKDQFEDARFDGADVTGATARVVWSMFIGDDAREPGTIYARRDDDGRWKITSFGE